MFVGRTWIEFFSKTMFMNELLELLMIIVVVPILNL